MRKKPFSHCHHSGRNGAADQRRDLGYWHDYWNRTAIFAQSANGAGVVRDPTLAQLGLSDAQKAQIQSIKADVRAKNEMGRDIETKRANLRAAMEKFAIRFRRRRNARKTAAIRK